MNTGYRGRFAPTPSGPLHFGSLLTALASYLDARQAGGVWLLRIDDLDAPRCVPGATETILEQLQQHGLLWDETPYYQSEQQRTYESALDSLRTRGLLYACRCTRRILRQTALPGPDAPVYPGTCRDAQVGDEPSALRLRLAEHVEEMNDRWQGLVRRDLQTQVGDFVVRRVDGQIAYQLACAIDESQQRISHVVRGADLLSSSFAQRTVARSLNLETPEYGHLPVLVDANGKKLSKQHHAPPIDGARAAENLRRVLRHLGQAQPPPGASVNRIIESAISLWNPAAVPRKAEIKVQQSTTGPESAPPPGP